MVILLSNKAIFTHIFVKKNHTCKKITAKKVILSCFLWNNSIKL
ncbi:hypothetical protein P785_0650 [Enterococcus faecalis KS19]|nr:hypothetical protein P785_0650 [Enterococcus faecalis KS19]